MLDHEDVPDILAIYFRDAATLVLGIEMFKEIGNDAHRQCFKSFVETIILGI